MVFLLIPLRDQGAFGTITDMNDWSPQKLLNLLKNGENSRIEAKPCTEGVGDSCLQTICAFANEPGLGGGYILLGVREKGTRFVPVGIADIDKIQNDIFSKVKNAFGIVPKIQTAVECVEGKQLLALHVKELEHSRKPCEFIGKIDGRNKRITGVWRRHLNGDYECDIKALSDLIYERGNSGFEESVFPDSDMSDIDEEVVSRYRILRGRVRPDAFELTLSDEELLRTVSAVKKDCNGKLVPTVAGILLFGKKAALRRLIPAARVDYIRISGDEWLENPEKRFEYTSDFLEPLLLLLPRLEAMVMDDIPRKFALRDGQLQREDVPILPQKVVREALVNALMHRDYRDNRPSQILRFRGRLEVANAGRSLKSVHLLGETGSVLRNPKIASVLYDLQFAETKGSGIGLMRTLLSRSGMSTPEFCSDIHGNEFRAKYFLHHLFGEEQFAWLQRLNVKLSGEEAKALLLAKANGSVCSSMLREHSGLDILRVSRLFSRLCKKGLLIKHGKSIRTYYVLAGTMRIENDKLVPENDKLVPENDKLVPKNDKLVPENDKLSVNIAGLGKRSTFEELSVLVLGLCASSPKTPAELARMLCRRRRSLKAGVIKPLRMKGFLEYLYPEKENHPRQAYQITGLGIAYYKQHSREHT